MTAESHLYKTIQKDKALCFAPNLPAYVTVIMKSSQEPAVANITARLYNSKPVKEATTEALTSLRLVLGVTNHLKTKKIRVDAEADLSKPTSRPVQSIHKAGHPSTEVSSIAQGEMSGPDESDDEGTVDVELDIDLDAQEEDVSDKWDGLSLDEEVLEAFDKRLGGSSDEESNDQDVEVRRAALRRELANNLSTSPEPSPPPVPDMYSKPKATKGLATVRSKTDFLPSLTMGGYWSGSESEPEDDVDVAPRKNRRGQRARQQIWEKKYGKGAKHIQNSKAKQTAGRDEGWDAKRGAQESGRQGRGSGTNNRGYVKASGPRGEIASGGNATQVVPRKRVSENLVSDNKPLHPSWEAAKKVKEQKQTAAFLGKKMTFD